MAVVKAMAEIREGEFVFPGGRADRSLSNMAMAMVLRRMGRDEITAHGFRSTFRDWTGDCTDLKVVAQAKAVRAPGRKHANATTEPPASAVPAAMIPVGRAAGYAGIQPAAANSGFDTSSISIRGRSRFVSAFCGNSGTSKSIRVELHNPGG